MMYEEYIPDIIEQGENRCETQVEGDKIRCAGCKQLFSFDDVEPSGPDPYSSAVCRACLSSMHPEIDAQDSGESTP